MKIGIILLIMLALFDVVICVAPTYLPKKTLNQRSELIIEYFKLLLIQTHLDRIAQNWNTQTIRPQKNNELNYGKPDVMFHLPELFDSQDFGTNVDIQDVICCQRMYSIPNSKNKDLRELTQLLRPVLQMPHDADTACIQRSAIQWRNRYSCENMLGR